MTLVKPQKKQQKIVYQNQYNHVYSQEVDFGEFTKEYFVTNCGDRAGILVIRDESVLLVRQYRFLVHGLSWEIPGGQVDEAETPQESARRECFEETGIDCRDLKPLLSCEETLEAISSPMYLFYTLNCEEKNKFTPDPKEVEFIQWVPLDQCFKMIQDGEIKDSFTLLALFAYKVFNIDSNSGKHR